jgi:nickel superoxide dismutase
MKIIKTQMLFLLFLFCLIPSFVSAHCEMPCGIYDDGARIDMLAEHATTIEKSMNEIKILQQAKPVNNYNQLIRWVVNKEEHANEVQHIVSQYFMTQRIKFDSKDYEKKLALLHQMLVYAMKCKQTTDLTYVEKLRSALAEFKNLYFGPSQK